MILKIVLKSLQSGFSCKWDLPPGVGAIIDDRLFLDCFKNHVPLSSWRQVIDGCGSKSHFIKLGFKNSLPSIVGENGDIAWLKEIPLRQLWYCYNVDHCKCQYHPTLLFICIYFCHKMVLIVYKGYLQNHVQVSWTHWILSDSYFFSLSLIKGVQSWALMLFVSEVDVWYIATFFCFLKHLHPYRKGVPPVKSWFLHQIKTYINKIKHTHFHFYKQLTQPKESICIFFKEKLSEPLKASNCISVCFVWCFQSFWVLLGFLAPILSFNNFLC